jgi:hypothetical protein
MMGVTSLLGEVGIDDAGFRKAVAVAVRHRPEHYATVLELAGVIESRRDGIANAGAWLRKSLAARGLTV